MLILASGQLCVTNTSTKTLRICDHIDCFPCKELIASPPIAAVVQPATPRTDTLLAAIASSNNAVLAQTVVGLLLELSMISMVACYCCCRDISPYFSLVAATMLATSTALIGTSALLDGAMSSWFESVRADGEPLEAAAFRFCDSALSQVLLIGEGVSMRVASGVLSLAFLLWLFCGAKLLRWIHGEVEDELKKQQAALKKQQDEAAARKAEAVQAVLVAAKARAQDRQQEPPPSAKKSATTLVIRIPPTAPDSPQFVAVV